MTQQEKHSKVATEVDRHILTGGFEAAALDDNYKYRDWYAWLLSDIALLLSFDEVIFAHTNFESEDSEFDLYVFTERLVVVARIDTTLDGVPIVQALPRRSLRSMVLSASERIDARDRRSHEWPGVLALRLTYPDLSRPIEIVANGSNPHNYKEPAAIVRLIESLSADLAQLPVTK